MATRDEHQRVIYQGVMNGPDCRCGHLRILHCGTFTLPNPDREIGFFDGMCQVEGCACTPSGYAFPDGSAYRPPDADLLGMP